MLLQANHNYQERGMNTVIYTSSVDDRYGKKEIVSRIGLRADSNIFSESTNIYEEVLNLNKTKKVDCVLIDEAQFLTELQVKQLCNICDEKNIPIMCYGIRTDFQGKVFEGSKYLLAYADTLVELKTICEHPGCSRKATMIARYQDGKLVLEGQQIDIGGDKYKVFCRKHYRKLTDLI